MLKIYFKKKKFMFNCRGRFRQSIREVKYRASRYLTLFSCNKLTCLCKSETYVANYCKYQLSRDKKILVLHELDFGQNAGQQSVARSLCSLIYNNKQGNSSTNDLIQIMNIGNRCYSSLSRLARHAFLMQSELPTVLNVFDANHQLEYSESYSGTVHQDAAIQGYRYCTSLKRAFGLLRSENYTNFILTVRCIAVAIYCDVNMGFEIFDSHARDLYGREQPQGTCVLLQVPSLGSLVHYFQSIHNNDIFEVRGVQIENIQNRMVSQYSVNETTNFNLSCALALYSLCYSVIIPCNYWNYNSSLLTIVNNGKNMFHKSSLQHNQLLPANLPRTIAKC